MTLGERIQIQMFRGLAALGIVAVSMAGALVAAPSAGASSLLVDFSVHGVYFGTVTEGTTAQGQAHLTNHSAVPIYFVAVSPNASNTLAEFHGSVGTCAGPVAPGDSCDIAVAFTPLTPHLRTSTLFVTMGILSDKGVINATSRVGAVVSGVGIRPDVLLSGASAGTISVGSSGTAFAAITNNSLVGVDMTALSLQTALVHTWSIVANACPHVLAPGGGCGIVIAFTPHHIGTVAATLSVTWQIDGTSIPLHARSTIVGTGVGTAGHSPLITLSSVNFGSVTVGSSASGNVVLTNTGATGTVSLVLDALLSNASGSFAITGTTCTAALAPLQSCNIAVSFSPVAGHLFNAVIAAHVTRTVGTTTNSRIIEATLSGHGLPPSFTVVASSHPVTTVGGSSDGQVTVTNTSLVNLTLGAAHLMGSDVSSWNLDASPCAVTLAPLASCAMDLVFAPHAAGHLAITVSVTEQFGTTPNIHAVNVMAPAIATAVLPHFTVSSPSFASANVATHSNGQATVTNTSSVALTFAGAWVSGTNAKDFSVTGNTCSGQIAPGGSCVVDVRFAPSEIVPQTDQAILHVRLSIPGVSVSVGNTAALTGTVTV